MSDVSKLLSRPRLYYNVDGIGELGMGFMVLAFSLFGWMMLHTAEGAVWHSMYALFVFVGLVSLVIHTGSKAIKNRITYRRTGYVEYRLSGRWGAIALATCIGALASVVLVLASRRHFELSAPAFLLFLLFAALYIPMIRLYRWKWGVFAAMILSAVLIAFLPGDLLDSMAGHSSFGPAISAHTLGASWLTWTVYGALYFVSGAISFWLYLRHTQPPTRESE